MKLNENAKTLLAERYLIRDKDGKPIETPEDMLHRVADTIASAETEYGGKSKVWAKRFYEVMEGLEFLPGSPTLLNAGRDFNMLSSCFVLPIKDSMKSIFKTIYDMSLIQKAGGGVGYDWSRLRPKGALVSSSMGKSSGPLSFMEAYNAVTETIKQGGMRKGANMAIVRVDHPDVEEFIRCKRVEGKYTNFNISVAITDEFMDLLERDKDFHMRWPIAGKGEPKIWKTVKAKDLWDKLVENAWASGDPGIWFVDKTNRAHTVKTIPKKFGNCWIESTNPCIEENQLVKTGNGWMAIKDVKVGDFVYGHDEKLHKVLNVINQGIKPTIDVEFDNGLFIRCTPDHKFIVDGQKIGASELQCADVINDLQPTFDTNTFDFDRGFLDGCIYGDGWVSSRVGFVAGPGKKEFAQKVCNLMNRFFGCNLTVRTYTQPRSGTEKFQTQTGKMNVMSYYKNFNIGDVKNKSIDYQAGFLRGWFECDGHTENNTGMQCINLTIGEKNKLGMQEAWYLLQNFGIFPKYYCVKRTGHKLDVKYGFKNPSNSVRIQIKGRYYDRMASILDWPMRTGGTYNVRRKLEVVSTVPSGEHQVYDLTVEDSHSFIVNGVKVANCGEQPLLPYESCNLGSINLAKFVVDGKVDYDGIERVTRVAVRFLDNVIDCNEYPLTMIEEMTRLNRKIGFGVMGWSDMLQLMRIPYNTQPALDLAEKVMSFINDAAHQASAELAEVRDPFPNIKGSVYKDTMRRNAACTTIAPTGSISMIAGCCGGIEPYYSNAHLKVVLDGKEFMMKNPTLGGMVEGIDWNEIVGLRGSVVEAKSVPDELKPLFLTALEIDWVWHLKMQAVFQKHTDNAVSKTINLPESATVDDVDKIYRMAWQLECKGVTVYRQGIKKEQVLNVIKPAERPRRLPGEVILVESGCGKLFITITKMQDDIFEVFVNGPGKGGGCANSFAEALCRAISMTLRAGVTVETLVKQLRGIRCPEPCIMEGVGVINSCPDGIGYALQEVMEEKGLVVDKGGNCPKCGGSVRHEEGCRKCNKCNWQKCG